MSEVALLPAARNDALHSYLKAIAVLRLLSNQWDAAVRGAWHNGAFELHGISRAELEDFLLASYRPTPILNPWNSGAGFDSKSKTQTAGKTLDRVAAEGLRWQEYISALTIAREVASKFEGKSGDDVKRDILVRLRSRYSDVALEWLDAAVLIGGTKLSFPTILGTGGNDGRLDFSINFAQRALEIAGSNPIVTRVELLRDALDGTADAPLVGGIFGQYLLGAGGYINPWDYVFAIEGAIAFAGAVSRRFSSSSDRPTIPFQFEAVAAGYASATEDEETRGELWLPTWRGQATFRAVRSMLRGGRVELVNDQRGATGSGLHVATSAADSIAAVQAAQTFGVASGIESFGRVVVAQRNGLAFGATYVGRVIVADRPEIGALSRETRTWIHRAGRLELGAAGRAALRAYNEGIIGYASHPRTSTFQQMLAALADLDDAVALTRGQHGPLPFLSSSLMITIDAMVDAESVQHKGRLEHRIARALSSIGYRRREHRLRYRIGRVSFEAREDRYDTERQIVWKPDVRDTLSQLFVSRVREAAILPTSEESGFAARLRGSAGIDLDDLADVLAGSVDWRRVKTLLRAYSIIAPTVHQRRTERAGDAEIRDLSRASKVTRKPAPVIPTSFAALRTLAYGYRPHDAAISAENLQTTYLDSDTAYQLAQGKTERALHGAYRRLRAAGADVRDFRHASIDRRDKSTFVAALLVPIRHSTAEALQRRLLLEPTSLTVQNNATQEEIA